MATREYDGIVVSHKMSKTLVVQVTRKKKESLTGKVVKTSKKYKVHCENSEVKIGDQVRFAECRPYSKEKHFRFTDLLVKSEIARELSEEEAAKDLT